MAGPPKSVVVDSSPRWCAEKPCRRRPFFGPPGGKPLFCAQHSKKSEGMVDVSSRRCEAVGCAKWPLYGNEGQKAKFCSLHKGSAMIDVRSRRCAAPDCKRQPSYGFEGKRACFCAAHKAEGMVDVVSRRCERPNCRRRPLYGYEGRKSQFCSAHKEEGQVDVCNRRCQHAGCSKRPCFGLPGQRPCFCGTHRTAQMVDVISHKCSYPGCSHPTGYEASRVRSKFCDKHKSVGLAGASLLQLAGTSATSSADQDMETEVKFSKGGDLSKDPWNTGPGVVNPPDDGREEPLEAETTTRAIATTPEVPPRVDPMAPRRRASYTAPVTSAAEHSFPTMADPSPKRRATLPTPLPSLESLVGANLRGNPKRHRETSAGGGYGMEVEPSSPTSTPLPPRRGRTATVARSVFGVGRFDGSSGDVSNGLGIVGGGGNTGLDHRGGTTGAGGVTGEGRASRGPVMEKIGGPGASAAAALPAQTQPSILRANGRFSGAGAKVWNPASNPVPENVGYLTSSPAPEWRQFGLGSVGRAASFDEARAAADKNGLHAPLDSKPRRASAFVNHGSTLSPVVTELGRRGSAFEHRTPPVPQHAPHYSSLLSAQAPPRSGIAVSASGARPLLTGRSIGDVDVRVEEESEQGLSGAGGASLWKPRSSADWVSPDKKTREFAPAPSRTTKMFHVMPATAVYTPGLMPHRRDGSRSAASSTRDSTKWSHRSAVSSSVNELEQGEAAVNGSNVRTTAPPPPPPPPQQQQQQQQQQTATATQFRSGGRRWSIMDDAVPSQMDQDNTPTVFVPAWGASSEQNGEQHNEAGGSQGDDGKAPSPGRHTRRTSVLTDVGAIGGTGGGVGGGDEAPNGRPPRRQSMVSKPPQGRSGPGGQARRYSLLEQPAAPLDHRPGVPAMNAFGPAWGAVNGGGGGGGGGTFMEESNAPQPNGSAGRNRPARASKRTGILFGGGGDDALSARPPRHGSNVCAQPLGREALNTPSRRYGQFQQQIAPLDPQRAPPVPSFVPAWGAASDVTSASAAEQTAVVDGDVSSRPDGGGRAVGVGTGASGAGEVAGVPTGRSPRSTMSSAQPLTGADGSDQGLASHTRRWSVMDSPASLPPDQHEPVAHSYVRAWGAATEAGVSTETVSLQNGDVSAGVLSGSASTPSHQRQNPSDRDWGNRLGPPPPPTSFRRGSFMSGGVAVVDHGTAQTTQRWLGPRAELRERRDDAPHGVSR